jgi:hypothetical protein
MQLSRIVLGGFYDWFVALPWWFSQVMVRVLRRIDNEFALMVTVRNLFTPLYGDKTVFAYVVGTPLRLGRIVISLFIYSCIVCVFAGLIIMWWAIPALIIKHIYQLWMSK